MYYKGMSSHAPKKKHGYTKYQLIKTTPFLKATPTIYINTFDMATNHNKAYPILFKYTYIYCYKL